jgi:hypothetical protein
MKSAEIEEKAWNSENNEKPHHRQRGVNEKAS